jgi:DNA phosphorothioation-dependent restriction protein DptG
MADGSQHLLVILTAVCCENKKQVQFNIKEIDRYANV